MKKTKNISMHGLKTIVKDIMNCRENRRFNPIIKNDTFKHIMTLIFTLNY
jgi:hypothetical protein